MWIETRCGWFSREAEFDILKARTFLFEKRHFDESINGVENNYLETTDVNDTFLSHFRMYKQFIVTIVNYSKLFSLRYIVYYISYIFVLEVAIIQDVTILENAQLFLPKIQEISSLSNLCNL